MTPPTQKSSGSGAPASPTRAHFPRSPVLSANPPVQQIGAAVLLQGPALLDAFHLIRLGIREVRRRDGITPSPRLAELQRCLAAAVAEYQAMSPLGHADVPGDTDQAESQSPGPDDHLTTREAATVLQISERHARRLAPELGGAIRRSGVLLFDRGAVEALAAVRTTAG